MNQALDTHLSDVGLLASLPHPHPQRKAILSSDAIYHAPPVGEFNKNSNLWETKQIEKTQVKEKQSHAQDKIYVVRQFAYIHGVAGISL